MGIGILHFFHVVVRKRHNVGDTFKLCHDDQIIFDPILIKDSILSSYTNLYVAITNHVVFVIIMQSFVASYIPSLETGDGYNFLIKCTNLDKVKHAIFSLNGDNALSPDGFGGCFYHSFWVNVRVDVCKVVQQLFWQSWIPYICYFSYS